MNPNILKGSHVHMTAANPEVMSKAFARWSRDSEYHRLLDFDAAFLWSEKKWKEWLEKDLDKDNPSEFLFAIHTYNEERLIGFLGLWDIEWNHGNSWLAIGIGDRQDWGKGYGTEAMNIILGYAFNELNLHRVSLGVFAYNTRAIRSYEKAGYIIEGRQRQMVQREGKFWDVFYMGILRSEWKPISDKVQSNDPK